MGLRVGGTRFQGLSADFVNLLHRSVFVVFVERDVEAVAKKLQRLVAGEPRLELVPNLFFHFLFPRLQRRLRLLLFCQQLLLYFLQVLLNFLLLHLQIFVHVLVRVFRVLIFFFHLSPSRLH